MSFMSRIFKTFEILDEKQQDRDSASKKITNNRETGIPILPPPSPPRPVFSMEQALYLSAKLPAFAPLFVV